MISLKHLPPSFKKKQRYIIFEIISRKKFGLGEVVNSVWKELYSFLGEKGVSDADPWIMKSLFDREKQLGGVKTDKDLVEDVKTCLTLIEEISDEKICIKIRGVSGTMKSAREKFMSKN